MPKVIIFNNREIVEPGAYARIIGGEELAPESSSIGKVLLIDTGSGTGYHGGSGINGEKYNSKDSIYEFQELNDFQEWIRGGVHWDIAKYLFNPNQFIKGCESLIYVSAKTTTAASLTLSFGGSTAATLDAPTIVGNAITDIPIINGGSGYVTPPVIGITGDGTGATATATITGGVITSITITNGGSAYNTAGVSLTGGINTDGGTLTIKPLAEGTAANGIEDSDNILRKGFAAVVVSGEDEPTFCRIQFWAGTYRGADSDGDPYGFVEEKDAQPELLFETPEFSNISQIISWMGGNTTFLSWFYLSSSTITGTGEVDGDVDPLSTTGNQLFAGGTETYNASDLSDVFEAIQELDYNFTLADNFGTVGATNSTNTLLFSHLLNDSVNQITMVVGGGKDETEFVRDGTGHSLDITNYYDSEIVRVVHGNVLKTKDDGGTKEYSVLYHAASHCGLIAGLAAQEPATWKSVIWDGVTHDMKLKERNLALKGGLNHLKYVNNRWVLNQEVTSMQRNEQMVYPSGASPEGSVMRIAFLLNKEIKYNIELFFVGRNVNNTSPAEVKKFVENYLKSRTAKRTEDNLILSFKNVKVKTIGTDSYIEYGFVPNGPINRFFITGTMFNINLTA